MHSSEYRPNVSPSRNEIHCSKMLFLIEEKLFGLVYNVHVPINETVTCNCDLQNVICQTNISYFENYKKKTQLWKI